MFCEISWQLLGVNCFRKKFHARYLTGFWIRLCLWLSGVPENAMGKKAACPFLWIQWNLSVKTIYFPISFKKRNNNYQVQNADNICFQFDISVLQESKQIIWCISPLHQKYDIITLPCSMIFIFIYSFIYKNLCLYMYI